MTELKPSLRECPFCGEIPKQSEHDIYCKKCDLSIGLETPEITKVFWNTRPQSLTEKVKLEPLDKVELGFLWGHVKDRYRGEKVLPIGKVILEFMDEICNRFGKLSLNQASQEDRIGLDNLINEVIADEDCYFEDENDIMEKVADRIMKEYILVRRDKPATAG